MPSHVTKEKPVRININGSINNEGNFFFTVSGKKYYIGDYAQPKVADFKGKDVNIRGRVKLSPSDKIMITLIGPLKRFKIS